MRHWLVVMSEDNWEICAREGLLSLGAGAQRRLYRLSDGDLVWVYINRKYVDRQLPRIFQMRALAKVTGQTRYLDQSPWKPRDRQTFNYARPIEVVRQFTFSAADVLKTMSFVRKPEHWGWYLMNMPVALSDQDVRQLEAAAGLSAEPATL